MDLTCKSCGSTFCVTEDHPTQGGEHACPRCLVVENQELQEEVTVLRDRLQALQKRILNAVVYDYD